MKRPIKSTYLALRRLLFQRCFYLFFLLFSLIALAPSLYALTYGEILINLIDSFLIVATVTAVGRTAWSFICVLCLAIPTVIFRWLSFESATSGYFDISLRLHAVIYALAITLSLRYVFDREVITADRLWGSAAVYLMLGMFWNFVYAIIDRAALASFQVRGIVQPLGMSDLLYFSFSTLTTTGFGDIVPITPIARSAAVVEALVGQLFIAILIAKLVGVYPSRTRY